MHSTSTLLSSDSPALRLGGELLGDDFSALCALAHRRKAASVAGASGDKPLLGKNIALLRLRPAPAEMSMLHRAALDLGARVAHVRIGSPTEPGGTRFRGLSQMLGRLYDAIDCASLTPAEVRQIEQHAGVPVFDDLESADHPLRALADLMTLREHGCVLASDAQLSFVGNPLSRRAQHFFRLAHEAGIRLCELDRPATAGNPAFAVDARDPAQWVLHAPSGRIDAAETAENHRFVLQAMLLATMAGT